MARDSISVRSIDRYRFLRLPAVPAPDRWRRLMQRYAGAQEHHGRLVLALQFTYLFWHWRRPLYVRFVRTYLVLMYTGFTLYLIYPMAPPWWAGDLGRIRQIAPILSLVHWKGIGDPVGILTATFQPDPVTAMPSMHAAFSMLVWLVLWRMWPRRGWIAVLYPLAMATTVLYTGDHYVIDIFVGWLFALVAFTVVWRAGRTVSPVTVPGAVQPAVAIVNSARVVGSGIES